MNGLIAFASSEPNVPGIAITQEMLSPVIDGITSNIAVILPIALGIFSVFIGIKLIPRLFKQFIH